MSPVLMGGVLLFLPFAEKPLYHGQKWTRAADA